MEDSSEAEETKTFSYFVVSSYIYQHLNIYNFYEGTSDDALHEFRSLESDFRTVLCLSELRMSCDENADVAIPRFFI